MGSNFNNSAPAGAALDRNTGELTLDYSDLPPENRLLFDWVSLSTRKHDPGQIMELIGMTDVPWQITKGGNGYTHRYFFGDVSISYSEGSMVNVNGFYLLEMSGQGCRTFETYGNGDYNKLFSLVQAEFGKPSVDQDVRITRLDIAFDDVTGVFDINLICDKTRLEEFVCRMKTYQSIYGNKGNSVTFGRKGSDVFIRIYDKARERGFKASDNKHWVRCELQLKDINAMGFVDKLTYMDLREAYLGVLKNYLSFKEPTNDSNKRRWPETKWWSAFLDNAVRISVWSKPGVDYNLSRLERYVLTQPIGSIKTLIELFGAESFLEMVRKAPAPKNPKYKELIAQTFEATKLMSGKATLDKLVELTSDNELEFLAEIQDGYREVKRYVDIKRLEQQRIANMKDMSERREKLFARIRRDLEIDKQRKGEKQ